MIKPRKEDLIEAFQCKQRKRNRLLYEYYKETYFTGEFSAVYVAKRISEELGIQMSANMVYKIHGLIKKETKKPHRTYSTSFSESENKLPIQSASEKDKALGGKIQKEYVLKNSDEYPKEDPIGGQLDDI
jgi:hypothetical protein